VSEVVSFVGYRPPARFDAVPWTEVQIEEAATEDGTFALLETIPLLPLDDDPSRPAARSFTTSLGTDLGYWYRVVWADVDSATSQPTAPVQNVAELVTPDAAYVLLDELFRVMNIGSPTDAQREAGQRCLNAAAVEIDGFVFGTVTAGTLGFSTPYPSLVVEVNLERAAEHWANSQVPFGLIRTGGEIPVFSSKNSFERHGMKLSTVGHTFAVA
jgi:hypothetical protein